MNDKVTIGFRQLLTENVCNRKDWPSNLQNVHTPWSLCKQMIGKLVDITTLKNKKILTINLEFVEVLCYDYGVERANITFVTDCEQKALIAKTERYNGINVVIGDYLSYNMKFDVIVGNPPYQIKSETGNTTQILWDKFVLKSLELLKKDGYLCMVHPSGWRGFGKQTNDVKLLLKSKQIEYLEIHNEKDGLTVFGAETRYDWYVIKNCKSTKNTTIKGQDGNIVYIDISNLDFIPNGMLPEINDLIAKKQEDRINIIFDCAYHTQKDYMISEKTKQNPYSCVYAISKSGDATFKYSSINNKGHFNIPKVIFAGGRISSANYIIDEKGEYGLTQFASGIVDSVENLHKIASAMRTVKFKKIMEMCAVGMLEINKYALATFRKDFWKSFVDADGNEI